MNERERRTERNITALDSGVNGHVHAPRWVMWVQALIGVGFSAWAGLLLFFGNDLLSRVDAVQASINLAVDRLSSRIEHVSSRQYMHEIDATKKLTYLETELGRLKREQDDDG